MSALPAPQDTDWTITERHPLPTSPRRPRASRNRGRSPHSRLIQAVLDLFPGSEVVAHHPAPRSDR